MLTTLTLRIDDIVEEWINRTLSAKFLRSSFMSVIESQCVMNFLCARNLKVRALKLNLGVLFNP